MAVGGVAGVTAALAGGGMWSLVIKQVVETAVVTLLLWIMSAWRPQWRVGWSGFGKIFHYGRYLAAGRLLDVVTTNIDDMIVGLVIGQGQLGMYSIGKKLYNISTELLAGVAQQIAGPFFAKARHDPNALWGMFVKGVGYCAWLVLPLYAALYFLAADVISLLFGAKWSGAVWILQAYCFVGMLLPLHLFHWSLLMASGEARHSFQYSMARNVGGIAIISVAIFGGWVVFVYAQSLRVGFNVLVGEMFLKRFLPFHRGALMSALVPGAVTAAAVGAACGLAGPLAGALVLACSYVLMVRKLKMDKVSNENY
jgi:PST family polysaccharide transporter